MSRKPALTIRSAGEKDARAIAGCLSEMWTWHAKEYLGGVSPEPVSAATVRSLLRRPDSWCLVGETSAILTGFARLEKRKGDFFGTEVFVRPVFRGQGIGAALIRVRECLAFQLGARSLRLSVVPANRPMLSLARKYGYREVSPIEMSKTLEPDKILPAKWSSPHWRFLISLGS